MVDLQALSLAWWPQKVHVVPVLLDQTSARIEGSFLLEQLWRGWSRTYTHDEIGVHFGTPLKLLFLSKVSLFRIGARIPAMWHSRMKCEMTLPTLPNWMHAVIEDRRYHGLVQLYFPRGLSWKIPVAASRCASSETARFSSVPAALQDASRRS